MRKMLFLALAGYVWKKLKSKASTPAHYSR